MIMASLENGIGSIGGFVAGTSFVVEHQTLAGLGKEARFYTFKCLNTAFYVFPFFGKSLTATFASKFYRILFFCCITSFASYSNKERHRHNG